MMLDKSQKIGATLLLGGSFITITPGLEEIQDSTTISRPVMAIVVLIATISIMYSIFYVRGWSQKNEAPGRDGTKIILSGLGLISIAAILYAISIHQEYGLVMLFVVAAIALPGAILMSVGQGVMAYWLHRNNLIPFWAAAFFGTAVPLDPVFNAVITPIFSFGVSLSGISWIVLGFHLPIIMKSSRIQNKPN